MTVYGSESIQGVRILNGYEYEEVVLWAYGGSDWREQLKNKLEEFRKKYHELHCEALYPCGSDFSWVRYSP